MLCRALRNAWRTASKNAAPSISAAARAACSIRQTLRFGRRIAGAIALLTPSRRFGLAATNSHFAAKVSRQILISGKKVRGLGAHLLPLEGDVAGDVKQDGAGDQADH